MKLVGGPRPALGKSNRETAPRRRLACRDDGGAGGIRTLDTVLPYTHFPGERLRPLGHRSANRWKRAPLRGLAAPGKVAGSRAPPYLPRAMTPAERFSGRMPTPEDIEEIARRTLDRLP